MELMDTVNLAALLLLGVGFIWKDDRAHAFRAAGWFGEGLYWLARAPHFFGEGDQFNAIGAFAAMFIFSYLAYHEIRSYRWKDDYPPLKFVTGAMFIAGMGYFLIDHFPPLSSFMIDIVAQQSVGLANLGGYDFAVGGAAEGGVAIIGVPIVIVLECTAIQAYLVTGSFLFGCRGKPQKRLILLLIIVPVVWIVNLFRNAIVIILVYENGSEYFDFAHNVLGKGMSLAALVILVLVAFVQVPELYEDINGLFELPWRKGPGHDYMKFVGRIYREKAGTDGKG